MQKTSFILTLTTLIVVTSFLGIPSSWKTIVVSLLALGVVSLALMLRKDIASGAICLHLQSDQKTDVYAQNGALTPEPHGTHEYEEQHRKDSSEA
jgi:hypothetical protein